ncbi:MAG: DNA (cytosine-5-)-methyltransferase [Planctomycetota bacterium]|nr:DNA (cytosine-5-)-methyltransferase [Planctomycetota bacterium]
MIASQKHPLPGKLLCEFFAGIGLVGEGLRASGWRCVYANDIDEKNRQLYESLNGASNHFHLEDVRNTTVICDSISEAPFLATASFPCVDLSLAGNYHGFAGKHSSTFFAFADVLEALGDRRPSLVMLENVLGFVASREGKDFESATQRLASLGYFLDAFLLDAKHFVPQSRPRVFVVGMRKEILPRARMKARLFAEPTAGSLRPQKLIDVMRRIPLQTGWHALDLPDPPRRRITLDAVIDTDDSQDWWSEFEVTRHAEMLSELHRNRLGEILESGGRGVYTAFRRIRHGRQRAEVRFDGLAGCLRTPKGGSAKQIVLFCDRGKLRMRWMSPMEYARLQGIDRFPLSVGTKNQQLYGFGDAVCVPAIAWIDKVVLTPIFELARSNGGVSIDQPPQC